MALVNGTNYDHIDLQATAGGDVTRHKLQDTEGRALIAPNEASSTASAAHAAGSYFTYNNTLYRATADIAQGGTITPNTNCVAVTVGGEVSELKSALETSIGSTLNSADFTWELSRGINTNGTLTNDTPTWSLSSPKKS